MTGLVETVPLVLAHGSAGAAHVTAVLTGAALPFVVLAATVSSHRRRQRHRNEDG